jgi:IS1 family transposase
VLTIDTKAKVLSTLVEGCSVRSAERLTGVHRDTITRLVLRVGKACERLMADEIRHVRCHYLQLDEVWTYVGKKRNHVRDDDDPEKVGDFWTWVAIDQDTKLVPHHHVGKRNEDDAVAFATELRRRITGRVQITTDKLAAYRWGIGLSFGDDADYGRIVKRYAVEPASDGRYSPARCVGIEKDVLWGEPDPMRISTSHVERNHLTMRMAMRRLTRLTNGFSKKAENLKAAMALHFAHYNFVRTHSTIRATPAVAAGISDRPLTIHDLISI